MTKYGLIGYPLKHSFSKKYFSEKFEKEQIQEHAYELYELKSIEEFPTLMQDRTVLRGVNVTIPYKQQVIPYLDRLDPETAEKIGAVNVVKVEKDGTLTGYNSDYLGFRNSLESFLPTAYKGIKALVLGTGGASKAVEVVLQDMEIPYALVSRNKGAGVSYTYETLSQEVIESHLLIINTTPLGTYPNVEGKPNIPYEFITNKHYCKDLVYNPEQTSFMRESERRGARVKNGMDMLYGQAEASWKIWKK
ncbi:shikimate dehydrogenase [Algivirga pacifica]|uniref:Shikimate dehydrogenase n=1 Tax=Algivirga pacifica TaxID=1162670 RepID=A0ABP9DJE7_9BACT